MSNHIYEIMTKATLAKGHKKTMGKYEFCVENIDKILGCWMTNHRYLALYQDDNAYIEGSYDVHIWYTYNQDSYILKTQVNYKDVMDLALVFHRQVLQQDELYVECKKQPQCIQASVKDNIISLEIEKEMLLKVVGAMTMMVENKERENDDEDFQINPHFIT